MYHWFCFRILLCISEQGVFSLWRVNLIGSPQGTERNATLLFYSLVAFLIEQKCNYPWHVGASHCRAIEPPSVTKFSYLNKDEGNGACGNVFIWSILCKKKKKKTVGAQRIKVTVWQCTNWPCLESALHNNCVCSFASWNSVLLGSDSLLHHKHNTSII